MGFLKKYWISYVACTVFLLGGAVLEVMNALKENKTGQENGERYSISRRLFVVDLSEEVVFDYPEK